MTYIEGFIMPVPRSNRDRFVDFSDAADELWTRHGATRILECWPNPLSAARDDAFFIAAEGQDDEAMVFSWIEWRDKATRTENMPVLLAALKDDPRFDPVNHPLPFDNDRVVSGCFRTIADFGKPAYAPYIQGFVLPAPHGGKEACRRAAERHWAAIAGQGAVRLVVAWEDDFPQGTRLDFSQTAKAGDDEKTVFAFIEWTSREACETALAEQSQRGAPIVFATEIAGSADRVIWGGFEPIVLMV